MSSGGQGNFGDSILNSSLNKPRAKGVNACVSRRFGKQQIAFGMLSPKLVRPQGELMGFPSGAPNVQGEEREGWNFGDSILNASLARQGPKSVKTGR